MIYVIFNGVYVCVSVRYVCLGTMEGCFCTTVTEILWPVEPSISYVVP